MSNQSTQKDIGTPQPILPGLYLVSTPIGNLRDITLRALDVLSGVDEVACEDTRVTGKLLQAYGIKKPLSIYNDHSDEKARKAIVRKIQDGKAIALVSDAGTPLISDPGYKLVRACLADGAMVTSMPGANAVLTGLQLSGLPSDTFTFHGFLPTKQSARKKMFTQWKAMPGAHVFYDAGPRLEASLQDALSVLGNREAAIVREITKRYETIRAGRVEDLLNGYAQPKGEIVLVIGPPEEEAMSDADMDAALKKVLKTMSVKEAAAYVAEISGRSKKDLYNRALELKS